MNIEIINPNNHIINDKVYDKLILYLNNIKDFQNTFHNNIFINCSPVRRLFMNKLILFNNEVHNLIFMSEPKFMFYIAIYDMDQYELFKIEYNEFKNTYYIRTYIPLIKIYAFLKTHTGIIKMLINNNYKKLLYNFAFKLKD